MDFDDLKDGLAFAGKIVGEIAGAIGSAMVEAFRLAMRILRAMIIMVKTIVQLICNIVGDLMDSAGTLIAGLIGGTKSFFSGSLELITKVVHIGFTVASMIHGHIVQMTSKLPSAITGVLQLDGLLEASKAVMAVNPFGSPPYGIHANGLMQAARDLHSTVFNAKRRRLGKGSSRRRRPKSRGKWSSRRRRPKTQRKKAPSPPPPPPPPPPPKQTPPKATRTPRVQPKSTYERIAPPAASSAYRNSATGRKDGGTMRKMMDLVQAYYLYSNACEFYQLSIQGAIGIASIFPGGFEEQISKLQVVTGKEAKFEDFALSMLLSDEVLSCPYTTCTSSLFSTGWDNLKKIGTALTGEEETSQLPALTAPRAVKGVATLREEHRCRSGHQCAPEGSKCVHPSATKDPCTPDALPRVECTGSSGNCLEAVARDDGQWYKVEVNDTFFSECPKQGLRGVDCRDNTTSCWWMDPSPACSEDAEPWCYEPGKYVPAPGCPGSQKDAKKSSYFPTSNLYYSYEACGGKDLYPNKVNDTCVGSSYQSCKAPCVWSGPGMQKPSTPLCRHVRTPEKSPRHFPAPSQECGAYVEKCLGMHTVLQRLLSSPKASESFVNYQACQDAMKTPNAALAELNKSCELYVTRAALEKGGYDANTTKYPASYLSNCTQCGQVWAEPAIKECSRESIDSGDAPAWCSQSICFVSPEHADAEPSVWFPGSGLFYSYRQCGSMDLFSLGKESCASIGKCKADQGCEVATNLDDPFCCVKILNETGVASDAFVASPLAKFGMLTGAMVGWSISWI